MNYLYPGAILPMQDIIENLIAIPRLLKKGHKIPAAQSRPISAEEQNATREALAAREAAIAEKERLLQEKAAVGHVIRVEIGAVLPNPALPRRCETDASLYALCESMRENGILRPITVLAVSGDTPDCGFMLLDGGRRLRAACALGWNAIPAIVFPSPDLCVCALSMTEALSRGDLDLFEEASVMASLLDTRAMARNGLVRACGISPSCLSNKLRLLCFGESEREVILENGLTERHARACLRIKNAAMRKCALEEIAARRMPVAAAEEYIDAVLSGGEISTACAENGVSGCFTWNSSPTASVGMPSPGGDSKLILKDLGLFFNTLDRMTALLRTSGIPVEEERAEGKDNICVTIRVKT